MILLFDKFSQLLKSLKNAKIKGFKNIKMYKKILVALVVTLLGVMLNAPGAKAQSIPDGYVLVPLSTLTNNPQAVAQSPISPDLSTVRSGDNFGIVGQEDIMVTATIRDESGNPMAGRSISLVSSRIGDLVRAIQPTTNSNGEAVFLVRSNEEGVSSLTAFDQTSSTPVAKRLKVVFLKQSNGIGGESLSADLLQDVSNFVSDGSTTQSFEKKIETNIPKSIKIGVPVDLNLKITNSEDGSTDEEFLGMVSFTSPDADAILPRDYQFTELDRGEHTFANALTFTTPGVKSITISTDDTGVEKTQLEIEAIGETTNKNAPIITSPENNFLSNKAFSITGTASPNSNLAVLVDERLFAEDGSDETGNFNIALENLADGEHKIAVAVLGADNSLNGTSEEINISLDTEAPQVVSFSVEPEGESVEIGTTLDITLESEKGLASAELLLGEKRIKLVENAEGLYQGQVAADILGSYSLLLELADEAGNVAKIDNLATVLVTEPAPELSIFNIVTKAGDKSVRLSWDPPKNHPEIKYYVISYGTDPENLSKQIETEDSSTTWETKNLNNNTVYYFQITSLDQTDKMNGYSEILSATPTSLLHLSATSCDSNIQLSWQEQADERIASYQVAYGISPKNYLEKTVLPDGRSRTEWEIRNLIGGVEYFITVFGLDQAGNVIFDPEEEISAKAEIGACHNSAQNIKPSLPPAEQAIQLWQRKDENKNTILVWNPVPGAISYRVYAGTQPNLFNLPTVTVNTPYFRPAGLMAKEGYYFAVRAVYAGNHEAANLSNITKVEVGPAAALLLAVVTAIGGGFLIRKGSRVRN